MNTEEKVGGYIRRNALLAPGDRVLVGVSGGADSVALLLLLRRLGFDTEAAHCNFRLRGTESDRDERFVRDLAARLGVPLHVRGFDTRAEAARRGVSVEMAARELRYGLFEQLRRATKSAATAVAHHRDDNAETLLLNLLRGAGLRGLRAMRPRNGSVVRPLLCLAREEIADYLAAQGEAFVTDSTNLVADVQRNKIRLEVMPLLRQINPAATEHLCQAADRAGEAWKVYEQAVRAAIDRCTTCDGDRLRLHTGPLLATPSPASVLHELLAPLGFSPAQEAEVLRRTGSVGRIFTSATHTLCVDRKQLIITNNEAELHSGDTRIARREHPYRADFAFSSSPRVAYFDADKLAAPLTLRPVRAGDRFQPFGMAGTKLVSDFLTDAKVARTDKARQLVLCCGDEIAWLVGRRSSERFRIDASTSTIVEMRVE